MTKQGILAIAKPILFNTEMVRAIAENRKTETRRLIKPQPEWIEQSPKYRALPSGWWWKDHIRGPQDPQRFGNLLTDAWAPYRPGDYLYVRETWNGMCLDCQDCTREGYLYKANGTLGLCCPYEIKWRPSIHMPKEAARLFLRVKDVRTEQLQKITEEQARAEGAQLPSPRANYVNSFIPLWDSAIKPADLPLCGWEANPWVWVIRFGRVTPA